MKKSETVLQLEEKICMFKSVTLLLIKNLEKALENCPYVFDEDKCECGEYLENKVCDHTLSASTINLAKDILKHE